MQHLFFLNVHLDFPLGFCHCSLLFFQDVSQVLSTLPLLLLVLSSSNYQIYDDVKDKRAYRPVKPNQRHKSSLIMYASFPVKLGDSPANLLIEQRTVVNSKTIIYDTEKKEKCIWFRVGY